MAHSSGSKADRPKLKNSSALHGTRSALPDEGNAVRPLRGRGRKRSKPKQLELFKAPPRHFGGRLLFGKRKGRRPLATRESVHLVMRSLWAKGEHSFRSVRHRSAIERILKSTAKRFGVRLYRQSINSNHIHLVLLVPNRDLYKRFVRVATGQIASQIMGGQSFESFRRGIVLQAGSSGFGKQVSQESATSMDQQAEPQGVGQKFFQFRPFTRVLHWGRDFRICCQYVIQNTLEAIGFIIYKARKDCYAKWIRDSLADTSLVPS